MLFKCKQEVQADLDRHTSLDYTPFDPAVKTTESFVKENSNPDGAFRVKKGAPHIVAACCHNHAEIKADVDAQVLSYARGGSGVSVSRHLTQMENGFSGGILRFQIRRDLTRKTSSSELGNSVS